MDTDVFADSLTNCLVCFGTGEEYDTRYCLITRTITKQDAADLKAQGWKLDWNLPQQKGYEVHEFVLEKDGTVQGMTALKHIRNQYHTHIDIVEAAPFNVGIAGKYKGVGAHLLAVVCRFSWDTGNEGYMQFIVKTGLVEYCKRILNTKSIDQHTLYVGSYGAIALINKYFKEGE